LLPAVHEAMPRRLVCLLGVLREHAGAGQVRVMRADYELHAAAAAPPAASTATRRTSTTPVYPLRM